MKVIGNKIKYFGMDKVKIYREVVAYPYFKGDDFVSFECGVNIIHNSLIYDDLEFRAIVDGILTKMKKELGLVPKHLFIETRVIVALNNIDKYVYSSEIINVSL